MKRESEYYWVMESNYVWYVARYYSDGIWIKCGSTREFKDSYFLEINEDRIINNKQQ